MKRFSLYQEILAFIRETGEAADKKLGRRRISPAGRIVLGLIILMLLGTAALLLPGMATRPLTLLEAFFTATSALTVTGLSTITVSTDLTLLGKLVLLVLIQIGGVGYMFVAALAMRLLGRRLNILDRLALSSSLGLDTPQAILKVLKHSFYGILLIEGLGMLLLYTHWGLNGLVEGPDLFLYALFHAISAFCNAGFDLFNGLPQYDGVPRDNITLLILGALIFIGGLGIPVLTEVLRWQKQYRFSLHARVTLITVAFLMMLGWVGTFTAEVSRGVLQEAPLSHSLVQSWFHSVSSRTAGFSGLPRFEQIAPATQLLTMMLMFIGCAPASMGGGITTGTFSVLGIALYNYAKGRMVVQVGNRAIPLGTVRRASAVLTISIGLVITATFLILITHDLPLHLVLFEVISAFATCGLSLGITSQLNPFGLLILTLLMAWGRLGALTIVIAVAQNPHTAQLVQYPEEQILIG